MFRNYLFFIPFLFISMSSFGQSLPYKSFLNLLYDNEFPLVQPKHMNTLSEAVILDSREKEEYEVSHIEGAKWIGFQDFNIESVSDISKNTPIIIYCSVGVRSEKIGKQLTAAGFNEVYNLYGGIFHYINEGNHVYSKGIKTNKIHPYNAIWGFWLKKGNKVYTP